LALAPSVTITPNFLPYCPQDLKVLPQQLVNQLFDDYIQCHFLNNVLVFTDGSEGSYTAGYAYAIPSMRIQSTGNLPPKAFSFTAECYAIQESLVCIHSLSDRAMSLFLIHNPVFKPYLAILFYPNILPLY